MIHESLNMCPKSLKTGLEKKLTAQKNYYSTKIMGISVRQHPWALHQVSHVEIEENAGEFYIDR